MNNKRGKKQVKVFFLIVNLIVATFAFSWLVGAQENLERARAEEAAAQDTPGASAGENADTVDNLADKNSGSDSRGSTLSSGDNQQSKTNTGTGKVAAGGGIGQTIADTIFGKKGATGAGVSLVKGLWWAGVAFGIGQLVGGLVGMDSEQTMAISAGLATGAFTFKNKVFTQENYLNK